MMKKIFILILFISTGLFAQKSDRYDKIKALKTAHLTEKLALTTNEAEKFWPIYNEYDSKMHMLRKIEHKEIFYKLKNGIENMSDADANTLIDQALDIETKELQYRKDLIKSLRKVIPAKKVIGLRKAEDEFKRELLHRYRDKRPAKKE